MGAGGVGVSSIEFNEEPAGWSVAAGGSDRAGNSDGGGGGGGSGGRGGGASTGDGKLAAVWASVTHAVRSMSRQYWGYVAAGAYTHPLLGSA